MKREGAGGCHPVEEVLGSIPCSRGGPGQVTVGQDGECKLQLQEKGKMGSEARQGVAKGKVRVNELKELLWLYRSS